MVTLENASYYFCTAQMWMVENHESVGMSLFPPLQQISKFFKGKKDDYQNASPTQVSFIRFIVPEFSK